MRMIVLFSDWVCSLFLLPHMRRLLSIGCLALLLSACGTPITFPQKAPSGDVLKESYKAWKHELSANAAYHFTILIPNDWKILQTTVAQEPEGGKPLELALFREPGAWIDDASAPSDAEILVEVFTLSGSLNDSGVGAPSRWLKHQLEQSTGAFTLLQERTFTTSYGPAADMLVRTGNGKDALVSRLAAVRSPSNPQKVFVIACSVPEEGYAHNADAFVTAISTFRLSNEKAIPAPKPTVSTGALDLKMR
jgi:hypothetical protein